MTENVCAKKRNGCVWCAGEVGEANSIFVLLGGGDGVTKPSWPCNIAFLLSISLCSTRNLYVAGERRVLFVFLMFKKEEKLPLYRLWLCRHITKLRCMNNNALEILRIFSNLFYSWHPYRQTHYTNCVSVFVCNCVSSSCCIVNLETLWWW